MKTIIFDLGNVLVDYQPEVLLTAVSAISQSTPAQLRQFAAEFTHPFGTGQMPPQDLHQKHIQLAGADPHYPVFVHAFCQGIFRDEAALEYALALRQRPSANGQPAVQVGLLSNTNELHVDWLHRHVPELWQLDAVIMSNEVGLMKPDPAIYRLALARLGATAVTTLFIDDIPENVQAAQALGISGIVHRNWAETEPQIEQWLIRNTR
ncbi:MAG: HAD family phosphatase [Anaerolineales bacterium]|nr:HAD family phosphatase [Anaerolineales bacterium]MCB8991095.1 HAD family phosphatase [Ardenticatenaceae bacterium]MCB9004137.1 HAD family phosphatase [Ardenticatenaceae bacterium]